MRCNNCGWHNEPNAKRCEKCNAPLSGSMISSEDNNEREVQDVVLETDVLKGTMPEVPDNDGSIPCPRCGYSVAPHVQVCPICNTPVHTKETDMSQPTYKNPNGTINPWDNGMHHNNVYFCQLQPIAWEGERVQYQPISYSGEQIVLNRANTDPNNHTITSKRQAILTHDDNGWFLENQSEHNSTFIQVNKRMKLQDGDIIMMGNRLFVFHEN